MTDELPETWVIRRPLPDRLPVPARGYCSHRGEDACRLCNGEQAERDEMWRMPRRDRQALQVANARTDPRWRELHGIDDETGGAA